MHTHACAHARRFHTEGSRCLPRGVRPGWANHSSQSLQAPGNPPGTWLSPLGWPAPCRPRMIKFCSQDILSVPHTLSPEALTADRLVVHTSMPRSVGREVFVEELGSSSKLHRQSIEGDFSSPPPTPCTSSSLCELYSNRWVVSWIRAGSTRGGGRGQIYMC